MKTNRKIWLISITALFLLSCQKEQPNETELLPQAIGLAATTETSVELETKAGTTFPNGGKLSILADISGEDWSSRYIDDVEVITTGTTAPYSFAWQGTTMYWPLDGTSLQLFAYTPKNAAFFSPVNEYLRITLPTANNTLPDLLYSQVVKQNKTTPNVNFGTLKHAFSKLTVNLTTSTVGAPMYLDEFSIITRSNAKINISTQELEISTSPLIKYSYATKPQLVDRTTYKLEAALNTPFLLFPDATDIDFTSIYVRFTAGLGGALVMAKTIPVSQFMINSVPAKLERGKSTILDIIVTSVQIGTVTLKGTVVPWTYKGNFESTIE